MKTPQTALLALLLALSIAVPSAQASRLAPTAQFKSAKLEAWHTYATQVYSSLVNLHPNESVWSMSSRVGVASLTGGESLEATVSQASFYGRAIYQPDQAQIIEYYVSALDTDYDFQINRDIENTLIGRDGGYQEQEDDLADQTIAQWQTLRAGFMGELQRLFAQTDQFQVYLTEEATGARGCKSIRVMDLSTLEVSEVSLCNRSPD